jgi:predicted GTPase
MPDWPWPETRLQRRTRIARLYRDALTEHAPTACDELDALLDTYNQHWITGNHPPINTDEPMTAKEIANWTDTRINNITNRIATHNIQPIGRRNGRKTYRLTDFTSNLITAL